MRPLRSEIYRLVRRWMPWVLLGIAAIIAFLGYELIWLVSNAQLQLLRSGNVPPQPNAPPPDVQIRQLEEAIQTLRPSRIVEFGVGLVSGIGTIVLIVFSASHFGTEWVWGTLRTVLASGVSRIGFLAAKYATAVAFALVFVAVGVTASIAASYIVSSQAGLDTSGLDLGRIVAASSRSVYGFLPYMALAALIALWFRSAGGGIAAGLVINFTESIVTQLLVQYNRDLVTIANLGIARNVESITAVRDRPAGPDPTGLATLPDQGQAALVLAAWTLLFIALAVWRLRTRDITLA